MYSIGGSVAFEVQRQWHCQRVMMVDVGGHVVMWLISLQMVSRQGGKEKQP
jgi:hypothetical protein